MAYTPIGFLNNQPPAINQTNLNKMDNELVVLDKGFNDLQIAISEEVIFKPSATGWQYFAYPFKVGRKYAVISSLRNDTFYTSVNGSSNTERITRSLDIENLVEFTPSTDAGTLKCFISDASAVISVLQLESALLEGINTIKEDADESDSYIISGIVIPKTYYEKGGLNNNGANDSYRSACRIRTINKLQYKSDIKIKIVGEHTLIIVCEYNTDGTFKESKQYNETDISFVIKANTIFRLMIDGKRGLAADTMTIDELYALFTVFSNNVENNAINIAKINEAIGIVVPDYYFENDYIDDKCLEVEKQTENSMVSFGFITDVHTGDSACNSMKLAKYISDRTSALPFMVFGGDVPETNTGDENGLYEQAMKWQKMMSEFGKEKVYQCRGNHDYLTTAPGVDPFNYGEIRSLVVGNQYKNVSFSETDSLSYYFEIDGTNTRIIILDCYSVANDRNNPFTGYVGISSNTYYWLVDVALKAEGKNIIIVTHEPINTPNAIENLALLRDVISAFSKHEAFSGSYGATTIDVDFGSYTSNLVCVISGHTHIDNVGCDKGFISLLTKADALYGSGRSAGTIEEGAFDVISIDYTNHIAHCTRIGSGVDRIIHLQVVTDISSALVTSLSGTVTWNTSDSSIATVSNGTVTKVDDGACYIYATDSIGTQEIWGVNV